VVILLAELTPGVAAAESPLRLGFRAGDVLTYERRVLETGPGGVERGRAVEQVQITCLETQLEHAVLLLDAMALKDEITQPRQAVTVRVDPRGEGRVLPEMQRHLLELGGVLDLLPGLRPSHLTESRWRSEPDVLGRRWQCADEGPDAAQNGARRVEFTIDDAPAASEVLGVSRTGTLWFDAEGGFVARLDMRIVDVRRGTETRVVAVLRDRAKRDENWRAQRRAELARYARLLAQQDALVGDFADDTGDRAGQAERLDRNWHSFVTDIDPQAGSPFRALAAAQRRRLADAEPAIRARADYAATQLGYADPLTDLRDLRGRPFDSAALREEPRVELLWSVDSPASVRMFAVLQRLKADLAPRRIHVVCICVDAEPEAARAVAERCGGELVQAALPAAGNAPASPSLPLLRVRDRQQRIRACFFDWRPEVAQVVVPHLR
jgi:hypothetical protein